MLAEWLCVEGVHRYEDAGVTEAADAGRHALVEQLAKVSGEDLQLVQDGSQLQQRE